MMGTEGGEVKGRRKGILNKSFKKESALSIKFDRNDSDWRQIEIKKYRWFQGVCFTFSVVVRFELKMALKTTNQR